MVGPAAFVGAWALLGAGAEGYDPTRDPISRLAQVGAPTRPTMTVALVLLGGGMVMFSAALRDGLGGPAWALALANGVTTGAVAALPLGAGSDVAHGLAAGLAYTTLAATPAVAAPALAAAGHRLPALASAAAGVASAACLLASVAGWRSGLLQRAGLTLAQAWVVAGAAALARSAGAGRRRPLSRHRPGLPRPGLRGGGPGSARRRRRT